MKPVAEELLRDMLGGVRVQMSLLRAHAKANSSIPSIINNRLPSYAAVTGPEHERVLEVNSDALQHLPDAAIEAALLHALFQEELRKDKIKSHTINKLLFYGNLFTIASLATMGWIGRDTSAALATTTTALYTTSELLLKKMEYSIILSADSKTAEAQGSVLPGLLLLAAQYPSAAQYLIAVKNGENLTLPSDFFRSTPSPERRLEALREWELKRSGEDVFKEL